MSARQSLEVTEALKLVKSGLTAYAAAKITGIALSTIYRAIKRHKTNK
jgi:transposase